MSQIISPYGLVYATTSHVNTISNTLQEIANQISEVTETLSKLEICCFTEKGEFKKFGEVFQEVYNKKDIIQDEKSQELLGPATLKETEKSNEKSDFDFLNQNVYDHIESIFDDYNDLYS